MSDSQLAHYLRLRLLVGYLGERSGFGWWPTSFFDPSSKLFLEPVFPKTLLLAQYHGIAEAARRLHDEHIGRGQVYHLFRLTEETEQNLHKMMQEERPADDVLAALKNRELAMQLLSSTAGSAGKVSEGPVAIGRLGDIWKADAVQKLAQVYVVAFTKGTKALPYFAG
jgi:hypothetical protein